MIKKCSLKALQLALNQAMMLDSSTPEKLIPLADKKLKIVIMPLHFDFYMQFTPHAIVLLPTCPAEPDATIYSSPLGLIRLSLLPASKVRSLFNDHIRITGDLVFGQAIKQLFDTLDIDWEGHLAHFTGDVVAHQIGSWFKQGRQLKKQWQSSFKHHLSDYLHEELQYFPPVEEVHNFFNDVDDLTLRVERLAAHMQLYCLKHEKS